MGRSAPVAQGSELVWNGKGPFQLDTGVVSLTTGSQRNVGAIVAPCDAELVAANVRVLASSAAAATNKLRIGLNTNTSGLMAKYSLAGLTASVVRNLMLASTFVASASKCVKKGDLITISASPGTAQGSWAASLIFYPR